MVDVFLQSQNLVLRKALMDLPAASASAPASTDANRYQFVGTWRAEFKGKTFLTINPEQQKQDGRDHESRRDPNGQRRGTYEQEGS
jgi:hypothetical protein